jgi:hypothetical protein
MANKEGSAAVDPKNLQAVVEEVDDARDTLELVQQFVGALPIRSHDELIRATGNESAVHLRGGKFDIRAFADMIPSVIFPVESLEQLVTLAALAVEQIPGNVGYKLSDPEAARRLMRRVSLKNLAATGVIGPPVAGSGFRGGEQAGLASGYSGSAPNYVQRPSGEGQ